MDTGWAWIVTTKENANFWDDPGDASNVGKKHFVLDGLSCASTAAPFYFQHEPITVMTGLPPVPFVDSRVTPDNNPAPLLAMLATLQGVGFGWSTGAHRLPLLSIGTGSFRSTLEPVAERRVSSLGLAARTLADTVTDGVEASTVACQWLATRRIPL